MELGVRANGAGARCRGSDPGARWQVGKDPDAPVWEDNWSCPLGDIRLVGAEVNG